MRLACHTVTNTIGGSEMKRIYVLFLIFIMSLSVTSCSQRESTESTDIVNFSDPVLKEMICASMGESDCIITMAEARTITRLDLSSQWQQYVPLDKPIEDIGGLESFINLESLDLSFHAITDIKPLADLKKLTALSLSNNPIGDISPLNGLTNLKVLILTGCKALDYAPLAKLVNLDFLMLDNAMITNVSSLTSLTKLKYLYLKDSPINNYFPLSDIYQNLEGKDFTIAFNLVELGFTMNNTNNQASYGDVQRDGLSVNIHHFEWGDPQYEDMMKCVRMDLMLDSGYILVVLYYPEISAYVFQMNIDNEQMNYVYNASDGTFMMDSNNRERFERMITKALGETSETDTLLAPIPIFNKTIIKTFGMTAEALYALPFE